MAELARLAEESGWDGVFLEDYVFFHDPEVAAYDPWVTMGAVAVATSTIRLGTCVTPIARRRVWKLAAEAMTLDRLSDGRVILGVGLGDAGSKDFDGVGELSSPRERAAALDESLDVLTALWSSEPVTYHGTYVSVDDIMLPSTPVQTPRIPIWVGGCARFEGPRRRALRWDGSCMYGTPPPQWQDLTADDVLQLRQEAHAAGKDDFVIAVGGRQRRDDHEAEVEYVTSLDQAGADWWCEYLPPGPSVASVRRSIEGGPIRSAGTP
jgi:alkanesulfonate monooxygenase SsuD/methylene tetrahydromethanopterin reductase-like flavin-dependent oxidoreductase (luciferase family)